MLPSARRLVFSSLRSYSKLSDNLKDYDRSINPSPRHIDLYMEQQGKHRPDFKRQDISTWQASWGDDYRFGLIFPKGTDDVAFSYQITNYKSLGYQPDFQQVGMAWVPEKFRGREILSVVTQCLMEEGMKRKNTLACNVVWSQNFWRKASGTADVSSCIYYISYYDLEEFKLPGIQENGIFVKNISTATMNDALSYDKSVFPFSRDNWMRRLFTEGIARIAYDAAGNVIGIGCLSVYPSGECVISPLYAENKKTAQLLSQSILKKTMGMHREKRLWRMQVRSNDQCRGSFRWIEPFLKRPPHRVHLSNLCYSLYPPRHFFNFSKVFVNSHPTNGPC